MGSEKRGWQGYLVSQRTWVWSLLPLLSYWSNQTGKILMCRHGHTRDKGQIPGIAFRNAHPEKGACIGGAPVDGGALWKTSLGLSTVTLVTICYLSGPPCSSSMKPCSRILNFLFLGYLWQPGTACGSHFRIMFSVPWNGIHRITHGLIVLN